MTDSAAAPVWDPVQQIYTGGVVPDNAEVTELLKDSKGALRIFGYGSLCWNPGTGALARDGVTTTLGRARGYKRCWAQKSADHRGLPTFPGIVCTLLRDDEVDHVRQMVNNTGGGNTPENGVEPTQPQQPSSQPIVSMTEGVLYTVPPEQVEDCLAELDFREKGVRNEETNERTNE